MNDPVIENIDFSNIKHIFPIGKYTMRIITKDNKSKTFTFIDKKIRDLFIKTAIEEMKKGNY